MAVRKGEAVAGTGMRWQHSKVLFFSGDIEVTGRYMAEEHEDGSITLIPAAGSLARPRPRPMEGHGVIERMEREFPGEYWKEAPHMEP